MTLEGYTPDVRTSTAMHEPTDPCDLHKYHKMRYIPARLMWFHASVMMRSYILGPADKNHWRYSPEYHAFSATVELIEQVYSPETDRRGW